jgi:uncharacterized repeat protein (TIGR03803 family)
LTAFTIFSYFGAQPGGGIVKKFRFGIPCIAALFFVAPAIPLPAQTFTVLTRFNGTNGAWPSYGSLIQGIDGDLYGTTGFGGASSAGTIFKVSPTGRLTTLYSFCPQTGCADGSVPYAGLLQTDNGNLYGTTYEGGLGYGTVFELTPGGGFTTLHTFCSKTNCTDGLWPSQGLIQAQEQEIYGLAFGELYELTPTDAFRNPPVATGMKQMIQATDGNFYGVGVAKNHLYAIMELTKTGQLLTLYTFCVVKGCPDGTEPTALMQAANGAFYGTTTYGGRFNAGTVFAFDSITKEFRTLHNFCSQANCADGAVPYAGLIEGTDGNFYGTTTGGGSGVNAGPIPGEGTVFQITPSGALTTLHTFCLQSGNCSDGAGPLDALVQGTDGNFYGTTYGLQNCPGNCGTIFQISMGLPPFVRPIPNFAKVGRVVGIMGDDLTGATSVTFNGIPASFKVVSRTYIKVEVPRGATTGAIGVTTPGGVLSSNARFRVLP